MLIMSITELIHNINILCPSFSTIVQNTYGAPIRLFITGEEELSSTEGTTQGDPLTMAMYALALTPLIQALHYCQSDILQVWYADNAMHCCFAQMHPHSAYTAFTHGVRSATRLLPYPGTDWQATEPCNIYTFPSSYGHQYSHFKMCYATTYSTTSSNSSTQVLT